MTPRPGFTPARKSHAEQIYELLPAAGTTPIKVHALAQKLPLTLNEVSMGLQVLKRENRAINPRGRKTNAWTRDEPPVVEEETPETAPMSDAEARVHEVERHLARIEGALAGISSRLDEAIELLEQSAEREQIIVGSVTPTPRTLGRR